MKIRRLRSLILTLGAAAYSALCSHAIAADTRLLPFQGRLSDANGNAIPDGAKVVQFKIYDAPVGGRAVWNGEVQKLTVNSGLVSTLLGTKADLSKVDFNLALYLELTIDANDDGQIGPADPPLLPRQSILPAVFANESADSRLLDGYDWSALFGTSNPADGTLLDSKIRNNSLTSAKLGDNAVTSGKIANGAITRTKLDKTGAAGGQALLYNGSEVIWGQPQVSSMVAADGNPANAVIVDNAGNVGIGTSDPQGASLAINGGVRARGGPPGGVGSNNNGYAFSGGGGDNDSGMFSSGDGQVQFFTDSAERMRIHDFGAAIFGTGALEFGAGIFGKEPNAGKIGYATFSGNALDIVGAGTGADRRVNFYAEGGTIFGGPLQIGAHSADYQRLTIGGGNSFGYLYGSFHALADGVHLGYNYYYDANGVGRIYAGDGPTSRLTVGYGFVSLSVGGVGAAPTTERLAANANGVTVFGTFNNRSDRNAKQDFTPVDSAQILDKVISLPLTEWSYKEDPTTRHIGPMAQDFYSSFNIGTDEKHIAPIDEGGVAMAAIQGLNQKMEEKDNDIQQLIKQQQAQIEALKAEITALKSGLR